MAEKKPIFGQDRNGIAVPAVAPTTDVVVDALAAAHSEVTIPAGYTHVEVASTGNFYFEFGDSTATATTSSSLFTAGSKVYRVPDGATKLSHLEADSASDGLPITVTGVL